MKYYANNTNAAATTTNHNEKDREKVRSKTQEKQVHNTFAYHLLTDAQPIPEPCSGRASFPQFIS